MSSRKTGELFQTRDEVEFEWNIKDFFPLTEEVDICFKSPKFYFSVSSWQIWMYPNGHTRDSSQGSISLYIAKTTEGLPVNADCSITIKSLDGKTDFFRQFPHVFSKRYRGRGCPKALSRSDLIKRKSEFTLSNDLTVICTLKNSERHSVTEVVPLDEDTVIHISKSNISFLGSLFSRYQEMSDKLKEMYQKAEGTDCTLKVNDGNVFAHRMILKTRSSVFAAMFNHDTKENQTGEVYIDDIEKRALEAIVRYMYSGDIDELTTENALSYYAAADKYDIQDIKGICSEFITRNLSVDWVCDVIKFSELYQDNQISQRTKEYFKENAREILKSEQWKIFARENHDSSVELLGSILAYVLSK